MSPFIVARVLDVWARLKRAGVAVGRENRVCPDTPHRPHATRPGELVETDTIHHVSTHTEVISNNQKHPQ